ncbi:hypothetical protein HA402_011740 [Bradysia odoriphaga]|nr:hypothetical protein HA402_011740 [Bradysia odoriphaga]
MSSINQLPVEILIKIFGYLPSFGRVSLVNKLFYDVSCSVHASKICVTFCLDFPWLEHPEHQSIMDSIENTKRQLSKVCIEYAGNVDRLSDVWETAFCDTVRILGKFSATIKFIRLKSRLLESVSMNRSDFAQILSLIPNVEHIHMYRVFIRTNELRTNDQPNGGCLKLDRLKTLELVECGEEFLGAFNRLPAGCLKELTITYWQLDVQLLIEFLLSQSNIKTLTISDEDEYNDTPLPDHVFDNLKLESILSYQRAYTKSHANMLSKQTRLSNLRLRNGHSDTVIDESVLNIITNQLSELEILELTVDEAHCVSFFNRIGKLKKLKDLTLDTCTLNILDTFSGLVNSRITSLNLKHVYTWSIDHDIDELGIPPMPIGSIFALAKSVPNLKVLKFDHDCEWSTIAAIMQHFNFVEVLQTKFEENIDPNRLSNAIEVDRCVNATLTKLKITEEFLCDESILTKLIAIFPNLKKLNIDSPKSPSISQFKLILSGFDRMVSLKLYFRQNFGLTAEYLDCIKDHKDKFKSIKLGSLNEFTVEHKKQLDGVFDVIRYKYSQLFLSN